MPKPPIYDRIFQWVMVIAILLFVIFVIESIRRGHA